MGKKFTKIRKWAEQEGITLVDTSENSIQVRYAEDLCFKISHRESSAFMSIHGWAGERGGLYLGFNTSRFFSPTWYPTQKDIIATMKRKIEQHKENTK